MSGRRHCICTSLAQGAFPGGRTPYCRGAQRYETVFEDFEVYGAFGLEHAF